MFGGLLEQEKETRYVGTGESCLRKSGRVQAQDEHRVRKVNAERLSTEEEGVRALDCYHCCIPAISHFFCSEVRAESSA